MTVDSKKILENPALTLTGQVAARRLKRAGVVVGKDLGIRPAKPNKKNRISAALIKRLAGG